MKTKIIVSGNERSFRGQINDFASSVVDWAIRNPERDAVLFMYDAAANFVIRILLQMVDSQSVNVEYSPSMRRFIFDNGARVELNVGNPKPQLNAKHFAAGFIYDLSYHSRDTYECIVSRGCTELSIGVSKVSMPLSDDMKVLLWDLVEQGATVYGR